MSGQLAVVEQATTALHKVKDYIDNGMESTLEIISDIILQEKDTGSVDIENKIGEMRDVMHRYANNDNERTVFLAAIEHAKRFVQEGGDIMEMEAELDRKLAELRKDRIQDHPKVREMDDKIQELLQQQAVGGGEEEAEEAAETVVDEDLAITQGVLNTKCPYTGKDMLRPVRNKHCGHHYDHAGFQEMCKKRARPKCPIPGCLYQHALSMDDVEEDPAMKSLIDGRKHTRSKHT